MRKKRKPRENEGNIRNRGISKKKRDRRGFELFGIGKVKRGEDRKVFKGRRRTEDHKLKNAEKG